MTLTSFNSNKDVYKFISQSSIYGNLGLFIGAGLPMAVLNDEWTKIALSWRELIHKCTDIMKVDFDSINKEGSSFPDIATQVCRLYSSNENVSYNEAVKKLKECIANLTSWYPEAEKRQEYQRYFESINPKWIITTNYDLIIESILTGKGYSLNPNDQMVAPEGFVPVYHLHGIRTSPNSIIITQEDYTALFRPNQYRQSRLPLTLKESVTVLIGYNLGDFNVLTAVDWARNVYTDNQVNYPHDIIQFYYTDKPKKKPYRDNNNIVIVEFDNLNSLLKKLSEVIDGERAEFLKNKKEIEEINDSLKYPNRTTAEQFIDNEDYRKAVLELFKENDYYLISGLLELFSKSLDITWERARPNLAFEAYNQNLKILLDILEMVNIKTMPPALIESVAYNLNHVAYYIGYSSGQSFEAKATWDNRKVLLPKEAIIELRNIAKARDYYRIKSLLKDL
jgi:hypothetical protein